MNMDTFDFAPEKAGTFLLVRRGLPLTVCVATLLLALIEPSGRGWYLLASVGCLAEVWPTFKRGKEYLHGRHYLVRRDGLWVRAFRPIARWLDREEAWILSFCAWNNQRVRAAFESRRARKALVLLPHCIQLASCKADVVKGLEHCFSCGKCSVGDVLAGVLAGKWNCRVSNRSHKAYREAREYQPDLIVAVACTDRLLKGLLKLPEVPSYVIPLQLPHGMCVDTTFHVPHLEAVMANLVESKVEPDERIQPLRIETGA